MKTKILLTTLSILFFIQAQAQTDQGSVLVGASSNLSFISQSFDGSSDNLTTLAVDGNVGYFVIDGLVAGVQLGFENTSDGDATQRSTVLGAFGRYYSKKNIFVGANLSSIRTKFEDDFFGDDLEFTGSLLGFEVGYAAFISDHIAIEPSFVYETYGGDFDGTSSLGLDVGFTLFF